MLVLPPVCLRAIPRPLVAQTAGMEKQMKVAQMNVDKADKAREAREVRDL